MSLRRLALLLASLLVSSAALADVRDGVYALRNKKSGLIVTVNEHSMTPTKIIQWRSELAESHEGHQEWVVSRLPDGNAVLKNKKSGLLLTVNDHSTQPGAPIIQWNDELAGNDQHQEWTLVDRPGGFVVVKNAKSGLLLTVSNHATDPADLIQWTDELAGNDGHQEWVFERMGGEDRPHHAGLRDGDYSITNRKSGLLVTVHEHSVKSTKIIQWKSELAQPGSGAASEGHQDWLVSRLSNGHAVIRNRKSGLLLTVNDHSTKPGAPIIQWTDELAGNDRHQEWIIEPRGGFFTVKNVKSGLFLTVSDHSTKPADLIQWTDELSGNDGHQEWRFTPQ